MPGHAAGEGQHIPASAGLTHPDVVPAAPRPVARGRTGRADAAVSDRWSGGTAPLRRPFRADRPDLPWATAQGRSAHWLRHTTLTWVERVYGYGVALAYAGHAESPNDTGTTARYVKATLQEVATALAGLTGEPHPLALSEETQE